MLTFLNLIFLYTSLFSGILIYDIFSVRREKVHWIVWGALYLMYGYMYSIAPSKEPYVRILCSYVLYLVLHFSVYIGSWEQRVILAILCTGLQNCFDAVFTTMMSSFFLRGFFSELFFAPTVLNPMILATVGSTNRIALLTLLFFCKKKFGKSKRTSVDWKWCVPVICCGLGSVALLCYFIKLTLLEQVTEMTLNVCALFLLFLNLFLIVIMDWLNEASRYREQSLTLQERLNTQAESLEALSGSYAAQRKATHDYGAHLTMLSGYLEENDIIQAKAYLHELQQEYTERIISVNSHHPALDALFNQKMCVAVKQHTDFRFNVNDLSGLRIKISDLTVICSNLLDNALEACEKLPEEQREIEVFALLEDSFSFYVRNRSGMVHIENGKIATTKSNPASHGFGLPNVETTLSYYEGNNHYMYYRNGFFHYALEIPNISRI